MHSPRYRSIDVLRGLTVAVMIVVNTPGSWSSVYSPFLHADWNGFTLTDWVFPSFLFVVGNAMSFSLDKYKEKGDGAFLMKVTTRFFIIFMIGYILQWFPFIKHDTTGELVIKSWETTRVFGVLQRIAICYLIASIIIQYISQRGVLIVSALILIFYQLILFTWGDLTLENNAVLLFDKWLIGDKHMYHGEGLAFDPEGLLSSFPAAVNVIGGYFAGRFIQRHGNSFEAIAKLMVCGSILIFGGLCWDLSFPMNKKIWTSSYVIYSLGINLLLLALLIYIIEIQKHRKWTYFFDVFGKNTLFIFVLSGIGTKLLLFFRIGDSNVYNWLYVNIFQPGFGDYNGSLIFALTFLILYWLIGYAMDKKRIYIKI